MGQVVGKMLKGGASATNGAIQDRQSSKHGRRRR
jgi:hypothetical protein